MHRDLKPENIFLDERMRPYIAGLGFAKYSADLMQS
jgi:serine/threonine protein kinase